MRPDARPVAKNRKRFSDTSFTSEGLAYSMCLLNATCIVDPLPTPSTYPSLLALDTRPWASFSHAQTLV